VLLRIWTVVYDVADDPSLVNDKGDAAVGKAVFVEDAKCLGRSKGGEIGHQGKPYAAVIGEGFLRGGGIGAGTQNLGF